MLDYKDIIIFGYSGHAYVVIDAALSNGYNIQSYIDINENHVNPYNLNYLGNEETFDFSKLTSNVYVFPSVGSNSLRRKMTDLFEERKLSQISIIHKKSIISNKVDIENSTFISAGVVINPIVRIGKGCIINTSSVVEHECIIGDFTHIAPGVVLLGNVHIGENCFIGAGSVVKQGVKIGKNVVVGANSIVLKDIPDNETWVGNPARKIK